MARPAPGRVQFVGRRQKLATQQSKPAKAASPATAATKGPPAGDAAIRERVRVKVMEGLKAARMRPNRPAYFMLCIGNKSCLAYLAANVRASHKNLLRGLMGKDTGLKYHRGRCVFEAGSYVFVGPTMRLTLRTKVERGLFELTGRKWRARMRRDEVPEGAEASAVEPAA